MFVMRYERDGWAIEQQKRKGLPLPDWFKDKPDNNPMMLFYMDAFESLHTCRPSGSGMSYIPWTAIYQYCKSLDMSKESSLIFQDIIKSMDKAYVDWYNKNIK